MDSRNEYDAKVIASADHYVATAYRGRGAAAMHESLEAPTLVDARRAAASLHDDRPVAIYAVAGTKAVHVENYDPNFKPFQVILASEPFWMLVMCVLVNRTSGKVAAPVLDDVRRRWPTPDSLSTADVSELEKATARLGFGKRRSTNLVRLAESWCSRLPKTSADVLEMPGCGRYAADSWAIFVERRSDVEPTDSVLTAYLDNNR